jgi:hypothetical protein
MAALVVVLFVGLLVPSVSAQVMEDPDTGNPNGTQYVVDQDHPRGMRIRAKYPFEQGPEDPNSSPWVINQPLYPEGSSGTLHTSIISAPGPTATGSAGLMSSNGAIFSGRGAITLSPRQEARRGLRKVIRDLD